MIADAIFDSTRAADKGGAQLALVNATGVRVGLPAGEVRYEDAFTMMPFGNNLLVMTLTGEQLKAVLEQQYSASAAKVAVLAPSAGFTYSVDRTKPEGSRVSAIRLNGKAIDPAGRYRVATNNYLASGGDNLTAFTAGTDIADPGIIDVDSFVAWIGKTVRPPAPDRVRIIR
jgi:5'-nucleotidase